MGMWMGTEALRKLTGIFLNLQFIPLGTLIYCFLCVCVFVFFQVLVKVPSVWWDILMVYSTLGHFQITVTEQILF